MSEYWKSTNKYWCKNCSVFVRDTKLERANHEATAKHQGAVKRSLRDLHRNADTKEREKERAKREVDRLNGVVSGSSSAGASRPGPKTSGGAYGAPLQQISETERQKQLEQLAELGVNIPTELRGTMAMPGEWTVTASKVVEPSGGKADGQDADSAGGRATGVKRERERTEEEKEQDEAIKGLFKRPRKWGVDSKTMPVDEDAELEALLSGPLAKIKKDEIEPSIKTEDSQRDAVEGVGVEPVTQEPSPPIKNEPDDENMSGSVAEPKESAPAVSSVSEVADVTVPATAVLFKKRKPKHIPKFNSIERYLLLAEGLRAVTTPVAIKMSSRTIKPGLMPNLRIYLEQRDTEYKVLRDAWLQNTADCLHAPPTWPVDRCMLIDSLPVELLLKIWEHLYQADLFHLALSCRALAGVTLPLLYERDVSLFDCLALRWACTFGTVPTLERTLSCGAPPNHVFQPDSYTGSHWIIGARAARFSQQCLFETPLSTAIVANKPEIVRLLLAHGADANESPNPWGTQDAPATEEWLSPINLAVGTPQMCSYSTFKHGDPQVVRYLLDAGANPNEYSVPRKSVTLDSLNNRFRGFTPLHMAMSDKVPVETVELLLERGADPTLVGSYQGPYSGYHTRTESDSFWARSPLEVALLRSPVYHVNPLDLDKVQLLFAHGGGNDLCELPRRRGVPPNLDIRVPLMFRHWTHVQAAALLRLFIAHGADLMSWGQMAIPAIMSIITETEYFIMDYSDYRMSMRISFSDRLAKICEVITILAEATLVKGQTAGQVRKSAIIDAVISPDFDGGVCPRRKGQTALRYVCGHFDADGVSSLVPVLLRHGADMNSGDSYGRTALHHAALFGAGHSVQELVSFLGGPAASGLRVDARDHRGWTPLHYACQFGIWEEHHSHVATVKALLDHGADARATTDGGWTPLSLAIFSAKPHLVKLLMDRGASVEDAFLLRQGDAERAVAPAGRILFLRSSTHYKGRMTGLVGELATARAGIMAVLSRRTGVPETEPEPEPESEVPAEHAEAPFVLPRDQGGDRRLWRANVKMAPFGTGTVQRSDMAGHTFEEKIGRVLDSLDQLGGLEAWVAGVSYVPPPAGCGRLGRVCACGLLDL
ncbi:ankyrin [Parathielavia hyrcaniae]|uniref:Ankyrin n=1 Tax=Parathielavia hyrcaniae TaxID=113614 RepID=A0AAN6PUJ1_9PEZI|nr:ankyrin [Parathielavia hyrcaniae]